ncbi:MAG TPA: tetratricopeptide repeat-containing sensor histidine kinase [Cyclobacteriaceae bacterium]|nr:tetratricopeptide repeat-containing sensor histidine kinase [Cyclobacteriaceae bacterium]
MLTRQSALSTMVIAFLLTAGSVLARPYPVENNIAPVEDTTQVNLLNRMAMAIRESDHELAAKYAEDALEMAEKINYQKGKAEALGNLGWVCYRRTDFVNTLHYSIEAMKIAEQIGYKTEMARSMNNIAAVSFEQKQYEKALGEFKKALRLARASGEGKVIGRSVNNIAYAYFTSGLSLDSADRYSSEAVTYSERIKDNYLVAFALRTRGDVMVKREKLGEALKIYQRGIALSEASRNNSMKAATYHRIAKLYILLGRNDEAVKVLLRNATESRERGYYEELERTYKVLSETFHNMGKQGEAYEYLTKYTSLHDSIYTLQNSKQIALLQNEFDLNLKQAQIELLTKDTDLKQKEIGSQRVQLYATIVGASCILLLVTVMLYSYQKVKRTNRQLEQQKGVLARKNLEIEEKSNELELLNNTKDKLFSIIGHDFRSPLHSLRGLLELIGTSNMTQKEFELYSKDLRKKVDVVYNNLDNILHWSVSQLNGINTTPLKVDMQQLSEEVLELYAEISRVKGVKLVNEVPTEGHVWADKDQVRLVIRNLVSNALKFTFAGGQVTIGATIFEDSVRVFVKDTGVGIADDDLQKLFVKETLWSVKGTNNEKGLGLGLLLCKEFIEKNNGTLDVKSNPGSGTVIAFTLPSAGQIIKPTLQHRAAGQASFSSN